MQEIELVIESDFDDVFKNRVQEAIKNNQEKGIKMYPKIIVSSGSFRPYCFGFEIDKESKFIKLDFYAAARIFGFNHTVENIADSIAFKEFRKFEIGTIVKNTVQNFEGIITKIDDVPLITVMPSNEKLKELYPFGITKNIDEFIIL